jgi:hypothetical protein
VDKHQDRKTVLDILGHRLAGDVNHTQAGSSAETDAVACVFARPDGRGKRAENVLHRPIKSAVGGYRRENRISASLWYRKHHQSAKGSGSHIDAPSLSRGTPGRNYRSQIEVDLLIGQDQLRIFPVEKRQVGDTVLHRSRFGTGWIASGRRPRGVAGQGRTVVSVLVTASWGEEI